MSLLKAGQGEGDDKEAYFVLSPVKTEDEAKVLAHLIAGHTEMITTNNCPTQRRVSKDVAGNDLGVSRQRDEGD